MYWLKTLAVIIAIIPLMISNYYQYPTVVIIIILLIIIGTSIISLLLSLSLFLWYYLNFCIYI